MDAKYKVNVVVRPADIDSLGHVNNAVYLQYLEWGRMEFYRSLNVGYLSESAIDTVVVQSIVNYRKECKFGDELVVVTTPERVGRTSLVLKQEIYNQRGELCTDSLTTSVAVDRQTKEKVEVPPALRSAFPPS